MKKWIFGLGAAVLVIAVGCTGLVLHARNNFKVQITVDGEDYSDKSEAALKKALKEKYAWNFTITKDDASYEVEDLISPEIDDVVDTVFASIEEARSEWDKQPFLKRLNPDEDMETIASVSANVEISDAAEKAMEIAKALPSDWSDEAEDCIITGFDSASRSFIISDGKDGYEVDKEKTAEAIEKVFAEKNFNTSIPVVMSENASNVQKSDYKVIGTFTTHTTASAPRNTNVRLACEAIDGTILQPGEQFSYNGVVGKRTPEKGYQQAPAYNAGETVMEYGGGVCQVSTTLYNACVAANFDYDDRTGHTFKPTYVTPGQDATVSFDKPDFKFTNNTDKPIGIKMHYENRTVTAEIFGVPTLEEGVTRYLRSVCTETLPAPAVQYIEDPTLELGAQVVEDGGSTGSVWLTYVVMEKDGQVISDEFLHRTKYRGHTPVVRVNTGGVGMPAAEPAPAEAAPAPVEVPAEAPVEAAPAETAPVVETPAI